MGVPSFYRWLVNKYPKIVVKARYGDKDTNLPNPNGIEFDNLYLDLNGIIHPCFHPDDDDDHMSLPTTYEDVFENIFEFIDLLFSIARPKKLLFLAIDGVAPRAKMNQQRTRRFKTSKEKKQADEIEERIRREFEVQGKKVLPKVEPQVSDSNVITPGTEFMYKLSQALKDYISSRLRDDNGWRDIKVILSDSNVPGEGEHKIMSFIRAQRALPDYDPNTRHCLYGLDADLIMLALATHELHFSILREDVLKQEQQSRLRSASRKSLPRQQQSASDMPFEFLHVWVLREYLELDMMIPDPPKNVEFDLERVIDDFLFICMFAGNDFLPHMPTLEINEGAIDLLMTVYKEEFHNLGGYLVDMQKVDQKKACYIKLSRVERFILKVGTYEEKIYRKRSEVQESKTRRFLRDLAYTQAHDSGIADDLATLSLDPSIGGSNSNIIENTKELKERLKKTIREQSDLFKSNGLLPDKVRLGATGWKERYYKQKFSVQRPEDIEALRKDIALKYAEGLLWVLCYYFNGVPSWTWYYPYHYCPFASDMRGMSQLKIKFQKGAPFKPFDQLMSVLPPMSASALPEVYRPFMTDAQSKIIDFYPTDFEIDTDGKRFGYQGTCKLPFINEEPLLAETRQIEKELTVEESIRNGQSSPQLFQRSSGRNSQDDVLCVSYEVPHNHVYVPRLLEGVLLPDKTVFENDIMATELWHEKQGYRPNTRMQYQHKPCPANMKSVPYQGSGRHDQPKEGMNHWSAGRTRAAENNLSWSSRNDRHYSSGPDSCAPGNSLSKGSRSQKQGSVYGSNNSWHTEGSSIHRSHDRR